MFSSILVKIIKLRKEYDHNLDILWAVQQEEGCENPLLFLIYRRDFLDGLTKIYKEALQWCLKVRKTREDDKTISIILKDLNNYTKELKQINQKIDEIKGK